MNELDELSWTVLSRTLIATRHMQNFVEAINQGIGLRDDFIYYMDFEEYKRFPDPFNRTAFAVEEVQTSILRYPNPEKPGENFRWDIHGRLLTPHQPSIRDVALVIVHGGAANEYEFLFTPDGPEEYLDLTKISPSESRAGIAQHIASLGIAVLAISLPGHYSVKPWPPISVRQPEFILGQRPGEAERRNRLAVYTYRMCIEAIKALIEKALPGYGVYIWGHSTAGGVSHLMEQCGVANRILGVPGFGTGMTAQMFKEYDLAVEEKTIAERVDKFRPITDVSRRSPEEYIKKGFTGPNQPWSTQTWFDRVNHLRPQFKPFLHDIEHQGLDTLRADVLRRSGLPEDEHFIGFRTELERLRGKKMLYFVGEFDGHWIDREQKGLDFRREVYALQRFAKYADKVRLVVIPRLSHYGHIESHNERLANLMVTGFKEYFA